MKKVLFVLLMCVCVASLAQADLVITNGDFEDQSNGALDVVDWYDLDTTPAGNTDWWNTTSNTQGPNPFPDGSAFMGDHLWGGTPGGNRWMYQQIGTKASCKSYSISFDYAQPTDGSEARSVAIKVDIYQGIFDGAAQDVDIADQGLTLICSLESPYESEMIIHSFTSVLDLNSANTTDPLWLRLSCLGEDTGAFVSIDNVQITSESAPCGSAFNPNPADGDTDVLHDVILSWTPGESANTHNVFFGTDFNDVNDATIADPLNTIAIEGLDTNSYDPVILEYGMTYYWRVDEVNAPSNPGTYKGQVWSYTVEPYAIKMPAENITATASSQSDGQGPEKTIDGSGLTDDLHSTELTSMWLSQPSELGQAWIQYDFDKVFKLHEMLVWNYNGQTISALFGFEAVTVEYSPDGVNWIQLDNVPPFSIADGGEGYAPNTTVAFNDLVVKAVKITANNNHGSGTGWFNQYGLSEVRFMYIPVNARKPEPESGATDVSIDTTLFWRPGREAAEHNLYLSTDQQAVIDGTATATTVDQASYTPPTFDIGSTYYWRIDEVNSAEAVTTWQGDTWSFSTQQYIVVDDFESYNDILEGQEGSRLVYVIWEDGLTNSSYGGSQIGYFEGSSVETDIIHSEGQSVPLFYDNASTSLSEVVANTSNLPIGSNWSIGSPQTLVLWIYGDPGNTATDQLYVKIGNSKVIYDGDIARPVWMPWSIDLAGINLNNVSTMTIGIERVGGSGGSGVIFLDDIRLQGANPGLPEQIWIEAETYDSIAAPMTVFDDPNASGGQYIMKNPDTAESTSSPPADGLVTYTFTVEGGVYTIAGRVITGGDNDSFWLRIPGATTQTANHTSGWIQWSGLTQEGAWGWEDIWSSSDDGETVEFTMPAGTYTLELKYREDESQLDALVITSID